MAANLAKIGVKINLATETKGTYFPKILRRDTSFYMLGWTPTTYDAHDALAVAHGRRRTTRARASSTSAPTATRSSTS